MMQIPKPSSEVAELFRRLVPDAPNVAVKPMFGNLGAFVNGNMFAGLFGDDIGVRLIDQATAEQFRTIPGSRPFGPAERPMRGYLATPAAWRDEPELLTEWIGLALAQVSALPPKQPKARKKGS
ncbi:TfoX/Sxy family protein [Microbacter sp. GSS18]|nr:TfoX/Sxy family protein [Microbacter sp. GSS18]